jgi:thiamine biosynthesis protein ThiS
MADSTRPLAVMTVTVNGEARELPGGTTIAQLVTMMGFQSKYVAVERNREVVSRLKHAEVSLVPGDQLEVVTLVGGG